MPRHSHAMRTSGEPPGAATPRQASKPAVPGRGTVVAVLTFILMGAGKTATAQSVLGAAPTSPSTRIPCRR
jgi:hypothetical protein